MKKLSAIFLAAVPFLLGSCSAVQSGSTGSSVSSASGSSSSSVSTNLPPNFLFVSGTNFNPQSLTVISNTTVSFTNLEGTDHRVVSSNGQAFDSGTLASNGGYSLVFTNAGTNWFFCSNHPGVVSFVVVTNAPVPPDNYVAISGFAFSPAVLLVSNGMTVYWTNKDTAPHRVTNTNGQVYGSANLSQNGGYSVTFTNTGTNWYQCGVHPSMIGRIVVTN